jgi:arylsulfatase A-like enzyme
VSTADLLPTLLGITESGVMARIRLDGRVLEEAVGLNSPNEHHVVLSEGDGGRSVRHQEWKLVVPNEGPDLLFNVEMDRGEESDLAAMFPDQAKELGWTLPDREPPVVPVDDDQATNEDLEQEEGELPEDGDVPEDPELSP